MAPQHASAGRVKVSKNVDGGIKELTREADLNNIVLSKEQIVVALEWVVGQHII